MNDLLKLADHSAAQSDRWLFVATLIVLGLFAWRVLRNIMREHQSLIKDHKEARSRYQNSLRKLVADQNSANHKLMLCLDNNSKVLRECRDELRRNRENHTALTHADPRRPKNHAPH